MPEPDDLSVLLADLRDLTARQRRQLFAMLTPSERVRVEALLRMDNISPICSADMPDSASDLLSPWLTRKLGDSRGKLLTTRGGITPATRQAIETVAKNVPSYDGIDSNPSDRSRSQGGRSLFESFGNMLASKRSLR